MRLKSIIIKHSCYNEVNNYENRKEHNEHSEYNKSEQTSKFEQTAESLMSAKGYNDYVNKHGYHFTDSLAEHVSKMMVNSNGQIHSWTASQVKKAMDSLGFTIPKHVTTGDVTYLANMAYADFFPDVLKDEPACLKYAHKVTNDVDGYEGMAFYRWIADVIGKDLKIDWKQFT